MRIAIILIPTYPHAYYHTHFSLHDHCDGSPYLLLRSFSAVSASDSCDQIYGFTPCTTTIVGNLFLIPVYGYLRNLSFPRQWAPAWTLGPWPGRWRLASHTRYSSRCHTYPCIWIFWEYRNCTESGLYRNGVVCWINCNASYNNMGNLCYCWQVWPSIFSCQRLIRYQRI